MKPIYFKGWNVEYAKNQKEYLTLPAYQKKDDYGTVVFCWKMNIWERFKLLFTGKVWVCFLTFNKPLTPNRISLNNLYIEETQDTDNESR